MKKHYKWYTSKRNYIINNCQFYIKWTWKKIKKSITFNTKLKKKYLIKKYKIKERFIKYKQFKIIYVRYADDFIITAYNKYILKKYIQPVIENFFKERSIKLFIKKTKLIILKEENFKFLGYEFKYKQHWKKKSIFQINTHKNKIILIPQKKKLKIIGKKLRNIFHYNTHVSAVNIINKANPIIKKWFNYFCLGQSYNYKKKLKKRLHYISWNWAKRKHPKWGKKKIAKTYFLENNRKFKNKKWTFRGSINSQLKYTNDEKKIYLIFPTSVTEIYTLKKIKIPIKFKKIHGYHFMTVELLKI